MYWNLRETFSKNKFIFFFTSFPIRITILRMIATISNKEIKVEHNVRKDVNREFLTFQIENGWDDVKKVHKKVLVFEGRKFTFSGWNSDTNECYFFRPLNGESQVAKFI